MYRTDRIIPNRTKAKHKKRNVFIPKVRTTVEERNFVNEKIKEFNCYVYWEKNKLTFSKLIRRLINNWVRSEDFKRQIRF